MTTELETPRITELHVRMDCNGCGNKLRRTLSAIDGVSEVYIDQATHKITVVGMADPERLVKAIRKTKRVPAIFSHIDPAAAAAAAAAAEAQPPPPAKAEGEAQVDPPPPTDPPAADAAPPAAVATEEAAPAEAPARENNEAKPAETKTPAAMDATVLRTMHDYPYGYGRGHHMHSEHWVRANHPMDMHGGRYEASPYHANATHGYLAEYGSGYGGFPVQEGRYYIPAEYYPARGKGDDRQITTIFSDENPNACSIA